MGLLIKFDTSSPTKASAFIPNATQKSDGLMSKEQVEKLDGLTPDGNTFRSAVIPLLGLVSFTTQADVVRVRPTGDLLVPDAGSGAGRWLRGTCGLFALVAESLVPVTYVPQAGADDGYFDVDPATTYYWRPVCQNVGGAVSNTISFLVAWAEFSVPEGSEIQVGQIRQVQAQLAVQTS